MFEVLFFRLIVKQMSVYSNSYYPELIGVSRIVIKSNDENVAEFYVCKMHCDQIEPRIFEKLEAQQWESTDVVEIQLDDVPCYVDFFKLLKDGVCRISLEKSGKFIKTCEYFGAKKLANTVKVYFGRESVPTGNISKYSFMKNKEFSEFMEIVRNYFQSHGYKLALKTFIEIIHC